MIVAIPTSKLPRKVPFKTCFEAFGSRFVFATRTSRFNRLVALLRRCGALQPAPLVSYFVLVIFLQVFPNVFPAVYLVVLAGKPGPFAAFTV